MSLCDYAQTCRLESFSPHFLHNGKKMDVPLAPHRNLQLCNCAALRRYAQHVEISLGEESVEFRQPREFGSSDKRVDNS